MVTSATLMRSFSRWTIAMATSFCCVTAYGASIGFDVVLTDLGAGFLRYDYTINLQTDADVSRISLRAAENDASLSDLTAPVATVVEYDSSTGTFNLFPAFAGSTIAAGTVLTGFSFSTRVTPEQSTYTVTTVDGGVLQGIAIAPVPVPATPWLLAPALGVLGLRRRRLPKVQVLNANIDR